MKFTKSSISSTVILFSIFSLNANNALAENLNYKWIKTAFWKAPQLAQLDMKLRPIENELTAACAQYRDLIFAEDGQQNWPGQGKRIDRFRTSPLAGAPINVLTFQANFGLINLVENSLLIEETIDLSQNYSIDESSEVLPLYTHLKATTGASIDDIDGFTIDVIPNKNSLTKVSRDLGLEDSKIGIDYDSSGSPVVKIEGRDVACDLLYGNIKISTKAPSYVRLMKSDMNSLETFYHSKLTPHINRILSAKDDSTIIKAARLGFHISKVLEEELDQKETNLTSLQIKGIFDVLFIPKTLEASANLVEINKKKVINLTSSTEAEKLILNLSL